MFRKSKIVSLILLFFISTTGLPIWSHYCEMMEKKSSDECDMCKAEIGKAESSCCAEEKSQNSVLIKSQIPDCCQNEFLYHKVEDEFLTNKIDAKLFVTSEHSIITTISPEDFAQIMFSQKYLISSSPPKFLTSDIYLNNSVLLI